MNEITRPGTTAAVPWPTGGQPVPVPSTSMLPGTELTPAAPAVDTLKRVAQGVHDAVDQLADNTVPKLQQVSDRVAEAGATVRARADGLRAAVRRSPLAALAAALVLGAAVARVARRPPVASRG